MGLNGTTHWHGGHATAPARKVCPCCCKPNIRIDKRSTFGIAYSGRLMCTKCIQTSANDITEATNA